MFGFKRDELGECARLGIELKILRAAVFRASTDTANEYRAIITEILESPADLETEMIEFLAELAAEANAAVGLPKFF